MITPGQTNCTRVWRPAVLCGIAALKLAVVQNVAAVHARSAGLINHRGTSRTGAIKSTVPANTRHMSLGPMSAA